MSEYLVDKLDIDALVTLAFAGPSDAATPWQPWGPNVLGWPSRKIPLAPDALGDMLWQANAKATLWEDEPEDMERWPSAYTFTPMWCEMSVAEGLCTISHYVYQTGGHEDWAGSDPSWFCKWLEGALIRAMPGFDAAPWGWSATAVAARAARTGAVVAADRWKPPSASAAWILDSLAASGVPLIPWTLPEPQPAEGSARWFEAPGPVGHWSIAEYLNFGNAHVRLYVDEAAAHQAWLWRRAVHEDADIDATRRMLWRVARYGPAVVELRRVLDSPLGAPPPHSTAIPTERLVAALDALGPADESWSSDPASAVFDQDVRTVSHRGMPVRAAQKRVEVISSDPGAGRLADLGIDAVDFERHSVVVIHGISAIDDIGHARIVELASPDEDPTKYRLELQVQGAWHGSAVVAVVDRLPVTPTEVVIRPGSLRLLAG